MGSIISLGIERFEIDWGKNNIYRNHSALFHESDLSEIPYYYSENQVEMKNGYSRELGSIKRRLYLLGYSPKRVKEMYEELILELAFDSSDVYPTFEQFQNMLWRIDIDKVALDIEECDYDFGEFATRILLKDPEISRNMPEKISANRFIGELFENIDPYIILSILSEDTRNSNRLVQWRFMDIVEGGWTKQNEIFSSLSIESKILIVTEGSSDAFIIKNAINLLAPDISDFFYYIDMVRVSKVNRLQARALIIYSQSNN